MAKFGNSSFWIDDFYDDSFIENTKSTKSEIKSANLYKLAASKRAVSNFVNIVTGEKIPVKFQERGDSYTDGTSVVIGKNVEKPKDFDVVVGLALHEGSHIKLSDFTLLRNIQSLIPTHIIDGSVKKGITNSISIIKSLWNYIEDRRIDQFVFNSAPGYRDYYRAMYDKYFNDKLIDKALLSDEHTEESVESYLFRIINLHNKNTRLSALKGLRDIFNRIDLLNISRLTSSKDTFDVALGVYKIILSNLPAPQSQSQSQSTSQNDDVDDNNSDATESSLGGDGSAMEETEPSSSESSNQGSSDENGTPSDGKSKVQLTDRQKELLPKKIQKQERFLQGDIPKTSVSKKDISELKTIEESNSELKTVGKDVKNHKYGRPNGIDVIVVKRLTESLMNSYSFPLASAYQWESKSPYSRLQEAVEKGIRLGKKLGKKLQVRSEERNTIFNRQKNGKIDKRMISSLGFGNENVFQYMEIDTYKDVNLHISVDASGSMGGEKWYNTMTNIVSIAKAVDMIPNLQVQITFRTTQENLPYVIQAYDSRVDSFMKVKKYFPYFDATGTTPEGLCFEAIMNEFLPTNTSTDSYFLNLSDGEPYFNCNGFYYGGDDGLKHTRSMVKKIEQMGIKILSYFIWDGGSYYSKDRYMNDFKTMYGKSATDIDVTSINQITKTINNLFLQK